MVNDGKKRMEIWIGEKKMAHGAMKTPFYNVFFYKMWQDIISNGIFGFWSVFAFWMAWIKGFVSFVTGNIQVLFRWCIYLVCVRVCVCLCVCMASCVCLWCVRNVIFATQNTYIGKCARHHICPNCAQICRILKFRCLMPISSKYPYQFFFNCLI